MACLCKWVFFCRDSQLDQCWADRKSGSTDWHVFSVCVDSPFIPSVCVFACTRAHSVALSPPTQPATLLHWEGFPRKLSPMARSGEGELPLACIPKFRPLKPTTRHPRATNPLSQKSPWINCTPCVNHFIALLCFYSCLWGENSKSQTQNSLFLLFYCVFFMNNIVSVSWIIITKILLVKIFFYYENNSHSNINCLLFMI